MAKLFLFMMVSLDGYFEGPNHDLSWHNVDAEFNDFAIEQTKTVGTLLFGRRTYELMSNYWPSEQARKTDPVVAELMNSTPKIVFSKSLDKLTEISHWQNAKLFREVKSEDIIALKKQSSKDLAVYGSNRLCVNLMQLGLVDEFRLMINPVAVSAGTSLFSGLKKQTNFELKSQLQFKSGNALLTYQPKT